MDKCQFCNEAGEYFVPKIGHYDSDGYLVMMALCSKHFKRALKGRKGHLSDGAKAKYVPVKPVEGETGFEKQGR